MGGRKDRLQRVLVVGATPAGIAATNKLGEMGIPVTLVDRDPDLNRKLSREEWRLDSGLTFNYALRPGLLRILRNPRIRCVIPGEVAAVKHTRQGFSAHLVNTETFVDGDRCILCGRCVQICPVSRPDGSKPVYFPGREGLPGRPVIDKRRQPLCQENCPLGVNAQGYVALTAAGRYREALELVRRDNVLPGICGRVCTHPCEAACRRGELDEPVAIRDIKRFLADQDWNRGEAEDGTSGGIREDARRAWDVSLSVERRKPGDGTYRVACVGSGPAGLAAAADLARAGCRVVVFEREAEPGGLLRYGIGPYRLPREILERELSYIRSLGVEFRTSAPVELSRDLERLRKDFSAVILSVGSWNDRMLGVPGEELEGVEGCIDFLWRVYRGEITELPERVAVIGDGNAAYDAARSLVRLGAEATIISWFPRRLIPADAEEQSAAEEEGVLLVPSTQVIGFSGVNGKLSSLLCAKTEPGKPDAKGIPWPVIVQGEVPFTLHFDRAIVAIGQTGHGDRLRTAHGVEPTPQGFIRVDDGYRTSVAGVYAAGDVVRGPSSVVMAMASGREAARRVLADFGEHEVPKNPLRRPSQKDFPAITADVPSLARSHMPERQPAARRNSFQEVSLGFDESQACAEAARCLQCGVCSECMECLKACGADGAIRHDALPGMFTEQAGVLIIADASMAPPIKGEDVIRAYSTKTRSSDVHAMMLRGFAAAAEAMVFLGGSSQGMKGHGLSFSPPDPELSPDLRVGVFVCRCDDIFGWPEHWDAYVQSLNRLPHVCHGESLSSACRSEGTGHILRTIREKGLTRVVLASCVCCPLDFICSSCTDQRTRLKDALFKGTGISRAMVETCNLRGEVLRLIPQDPDAADRHFTGLIERSVGRARKLKSMPSPARPYNFTTAVVGNSEAVVKSALTLAQLGLEVFHLGTPNEPLPEPLAHPNVHSFVGSSVRSLRGTLGNFQVAVELDGHEQVLQVGAVILGERARKRIPYIPLEDLPPHRVEVSMQKRGVVGIPFHVAGSTSVPGLFLANPSGIPVSERVKGTAAAISAASVMPRSPRKNKGYTVVVDESLCRGCGRCMQVCPYQAVSFRSNGIGGWFAVVDEALCKGCGNCITHCPSSAADSPYRNRQVLEQMIQEILL
ncbi:MAG: FAD-dependent oxidoreductase [Deltaproteobacteria bacterium]|nr:FAD-dependent oxidoreductase [Deltaproteobacteria bacterium]